MDKSDVVDSDLEKLKDTSGKYVLRKVDKGDVIRYGVSTSGSMAYTELLYDVEAEGESPIKNLKALAYSSNGKRYGSARDLDENTFYYFAVGVATNVSHNDERCYITTYEYGKPIQIKMDVNPYATKPILLYNLKDDKPTPKAAKFEDIEAGDMIIINRREKFEYNFIYVVRYPSNINLLDEINKLQAGEMSVNSAMADFMSDSSLTLDETPKNSLEELLDGKNEASETTEEILPKVEATEDEPEKEAPAEEDSDKETPAQPPEKPEEEAEITEETEETEESESGDAVETAQGEENETEEEQEENAE